MPSALRYVPAALALIAISLLAVGCGADVDEEKDVKEGEPVKVGELRYNVQLTRFLNPANVEDRDYLTGQRPAPSGQKYLGVFLQVENASDSSAPLPEDYEVRDTRGTLFRPVPSRSLYAMPLGGQLEPDGELPARDTTAASGPIKGAMILFLVREQTADNRPLELEIPGPGDEVGKVELDI